MLLLLLAIKTLLRFIVTAGKIFGYIEGWLGNKTPSFELEEGGVGRDHHLFCGLVGSVRV